MRNVGIRSRGAGTRNGVEAGAAGRHEPLHRSDLPRAAGARSRQRLHRPVGPAGGAGDEAFARAGPAGPARGLRAAVRQQRVRRPLHHRRAHRSHVRDAGVRRRRRQRRKRRLSSTSTPGCANTASSTRDRRSRRMPRSSSPGRARPTRSSRLYQPLEALTRAHQRHAARPLRAGTVGALLDLPAVRQASWPCSGWRAKSTASSATGA